MFGRWRSDQGQELAEYAIIFIVLMTLVLGIIEFGVILFTQNSLTNAAREGARFAAVRNNQQYIPASETTQACPGTNQVIVRVCQRLPGVPNASNVNVTVARVAGPAVRVTVNYGYSPFFGLIGALLPNTLPLGSRSTMRLE